VSSRQTPSSPVTRRHLLLVAPAAALAFAAACKKGQPASCGDTSGLAEADVTARNSLGYADRAMDAAQLCVKCRQYVPAPSSGACGTCKIMKGPIHPNGTCRAFAGT
jgi:hypothetical protein